MGRGSALNFNLPTGRVTRETEAIGLDIGAFAVKMVFLHGDAEGRLTCRAVSCALPPNCVKRGLVTSRHEVAEQIRAAWRALGKPRRIAALSTPMDQALFRWVEMPVMDSRAMAEAASFEARRYLSSPVTEAAVALHALKPMKDKTRRNPIKVHPGEQPEPPTDQRISALLAAAPAATVKSRVEALEAAGLEVAAVELESFALLRAAPLPSQGAFWRGRSTGYLMLGEEMSSLTIAQDGRPTFTRSIPWGTHRLVQTLAEELALPGDAARSILESQQSLMSQSGELECRQGERKHYSAQTGPVFQSLVRELTRLLSYYRSLFPERSYEGSLATLEISGGLAALDGLSPYLKRNLGTAITPAGTPPILQDPIQFVAGTHSREITTFPVAVGLALGLLYQGRQAGTGIEERERLWRREAA